MARLVNAPFLRAGPLQLDHVGPEPRAAGAEQARDTSGSTEGLRAATGERKPQRRRATHPSLRRARLRTTTQT